MHTVLFVQFYRGWLQNALSKFVLHAQIINDSEFAGIKIMTIIKPYPGTGNHSHSEQCIGKYSVLNCK